MKRDVKPVVWMGSSRDELKRFPEEVRRDMGQALYTAQQGETDPAAKPLKGFGSANVMEQKNIELIRQRLAAANRHHKERQN